MVNADASPFRRSTACLSPVRGSRCGIFATCDMLRPQSLVTSASDRVQCWGHKNMRRNALTAAIIFVVAHFALLTGVAAPEKFYFDEVHYVPAARQMLANDASERLNPMH